MNKTEIVCTFMEDEFHKKEDIKGKIEEFLKTNTDGFKLIYKYDYRTCPKRKEGCNILYESQMFELHYEIYLDSVAAHALIDFYFQWCFIGSQSEFQGSLQWVNRGYDVPIIPRISKHEPIHIIRQENIRNISFGVMINSYSFLEERIINAGKHPFMQFRFRHVPQSLRVLMHIDHECPDPPRRKEEVELEINYNSIRRIIIQISNHPINRDEGIITLFLRLIHPPIAYTKDDREKKLVRCMRIGCGSGCSSFKTFELRHLGSLNVMKLEYITKVHSVMEYLSRFISKCPSAEVMFCPIKILKRPTSQLRNEVQTCIDKLYREISFRVAYAVDACVHISLDFRRQAALLSKEDRDAFFTDLESKAKRDEENGTRILESTMFFLMKSLDEGNIIIYREAVGESYSTFKKEQERKRKQNAGTEEKKGAVGMKTVYKIFMTPSRTILRPPTEHSDNRILRAFNPDYALRVAFRDDDLSRLSKNAVVKTFLEATVFNFLKEIEVVDRKYEFLGASSSQLRDHGCWMYAKDEKGRTAKTIQDSLGTFDDKNVAKRLARMGQSFSATTEAVKITGDISFEEIEDFKGGTHPDSLNPYTFSDGVGKISQKLAEKVCTVLEIPFDETRPVPSAYQIRFKGVKGMLALDPSLEGEKLCYRPSMKKFNCETSEALEVIKWSDARMLQLNKQIITIMEQLGVDKSVFLNYQEQNIIEITDALVYEQRAGELLTQYVKQDEQGFINFKDLRFKGISLIRDPFFRSVLLTIYRNILSGLRSKARINIPWKYGRNLYGVIDEYNVLNYGEVYIQYTIRHDESLDSSEPVRGTKIVTGPVVVTKCPALHPGDVRTLMAVDRPELAHLRDVIVFPQKGPRPHPNEMAGSDLDGDEYVAIWDKKLFFRDHIPDIPQRNEEPMIFPDDPPLEHPGEIKNEDYFEFFCDYIINDNVGIMSNAHLAWADCEGIFTNRCKSIALKTARCLDFAKTGIVEQLTPEERVKSYPDFMEKQDHMRTYLSEKALGVLYRRCKALEQSLNYKSLGLDDKYFEELLIYYGYKDYLEPAKDFVKFYSEKMQQIMEHFGVMTESEICAVMVNKVCKYQSDKWIELTQLEEQLEKQRAFLIKRVKAFFDNLLKKYNEDSDARYKILSAVYVICYAPELAGVEKDFTVFHGLPWLFAENLCEIIEVKRSSSGGAGWVMPTDSPLAQKINDAIKRTGVILEDLSDQYKCSCLYLAKWLREAELIYSDKNEQGICLICLKKIFSISLDVEERADASPGSYILAFLRFCSQEGKISSFKGSYNNCTNNCGIRSLNERLLYDITMFSMTLYSKLAVTGDVCAIPGLKCDVDHSALDDEKNVERRETSPIVLNIWTSQNLNWIEDNEKLIAKKISEEIGDNSNVVLHYEGSMVQAILYTSEYRRQKFIEKVQSFRSEASFMKYLKDLTGVPLPECGREDRCRSRVFRRRN